MTVAEGERRFARRDGKWAALEITGYLSKQRRYQVRWEEDGKSGVVPACGGAFRLSNPDSTPLKVQSVPRPRRRVVATSTKKAKKAVVPHTVAGKLF
eukprot:1905436-Pyramimonas_sp.AAC.1